MSASLTVAPGASLFACPRPVELHCGGRLEHVELGFELAGPTGAPVVIAFGGISSDQHVAATNANRKTGWWEPCVGPGKGVDRTKFRVLGIDWIRTQERITSHDQARVVKLLLDHLGIDRVHAFAGCSFGGMVGLAFASLFPERVDRLVALCAPHRSHPYSTGWRSLQRRVLRLGMATGCTAESLAIARGIGMQTYRSPEEFLRRFDEGPELTEEATTFPVEGYLGARGEAFAHRHDARILHSLSLAIDLHDVDPASVRVPTTVVGFTSDQLVPFAQLEQLAAGLAGPSRLVRLESEFGHDGFLKESEQLEPVLRRALEEVTP